MREPARGVPAPLPRRWHLILASCVAGDVWQPLRMLWLRSCGSLLISEASDAVESRRALVHGRTLVLTHTNTHIHTYNTHAHS